MAKLTWTSEAELWLKDIYDYIANDNPDAAKKVINEIYNKAQVLLEQPEISYRYEHDSGEEIRIFLYGHYRITYVVKLEQEVVVLGIFHGALQIEDYLII